VNAARSRPADAADRIAARWFANQWAPGLVVGVIRDGELDHVAGFGTLRVGEDAPPSADSIFRIASMTKSFTAATVLLLRDEGRLRLDDPIAMHVPELTDLHGPTADSRPVTIRQLLTMTAGFPTDDPWGDRQQGLDLERFGALLRGGLSFAFAPGTRFEYSNLGYGILGRLITNVAGREYREVVRERLLAPLGMRSSGYLAEELPVDRLAHGYVRRDDAWLPEPMDPYGALASMGGLFTTVRDLSAWVLGFLDAFPPRDEPEAGHPLGRASRREMQQPMTHDRLRPIPVSPDVGAQAEAEAYGFGLFVVHDLRLGRVISHSGGYPGFGANMRWHPASGLGVITLANGRYAPATFLARDILGGLVLPEPVLAARPATRPATRGTEPAAPTVAARAVVERLLAGWDQAAAAQLFAMNVELDEPLERRRAEIERIRARHGQLSEDHTEAPVSETPFHLAWWLRGERGGRVRVEIRLSPELPPRVQMLRLTSVPEPDPRLARTVDRILAALGEPAAGWPMEVEIGEPADRSLLGLLAFPIALDHASLDRACRAAAARFMPLGAWRAVGGDGATTLIVRAPGRDAVLELGVALDGEGRLIQATLAMAAPEPDA
jgi:serine-type D-Ala-D-Ala carboxypeptidase/endopeptidase